MTIGKAIFAQLSAASAVAAIVVDRIAPAIAPLDGKVYPQIVYDGDAEEDEQAFDGPTGLVTQTVRIASIAVSYAEADALATAVRVAISGGSGTWGGVRVLGCFLEDAIETTESDDDAGQQSTRFVIEQTYSFSFTQ